MNKTWNLKEMKKLIPLALPVLVVNLSIVGMGAVDAIVAGRAGVTDMAAVALGSSVYLPVALFACGVLMIIGPVIVPLSMRTTGRAGLRFESANAAGGR